MACAVLYEKACALVYALARSMLPPPHEFSNWWERWLGNRCVPSVVSCEFRPNNPEQVLARWNAIAPIHAENPEEAEQLMAQRTWDSEHGKFCTGFLMGQDDDAVYILTCAHALGPAYNGQNPLTPVQANGLFQPFILCDHKERRYRHGQDENRHYTWVDIARISCPRDLILLRMGKYRLSLYCEHEYPLMQIAQEFPAPFKTVVMVSRPPLRNRTRAMGHVSKQARSLTALAMENPYNYEMMLSEVNMNSEFGSSGAPLVYGNVQVVGVLHGGEKGVSYFVSLHDIRAALTEFGFEGL